jgi:hypothetical protein
MTPRKLGRLSGFKQVIFPLKLSGVWGFSHAHPGVLLPINLNSEDPHVKKEINVKQLQAGPSGGSQKQAQVTAPCFPATKHLQ